MTSSDSYFKEVFREFYELSYTVSSSKKVSPGFSDHIVTDYIILRVTPTGNIIHYLFNGTSIFIPEKWIDLFSSFNTHSGHRILECFDEDVDGSLSRFGYLMVNLISCLDGRLSKINGEKLLTVLGDISVIGTKRFREWCLLEFGLSLDPIEYRSLDENLEI